MNLTQFARNLFGKAMVDGQKCPSLVFGIKRNHDEQMMFMMDCAAANPNGFPTNWGDRFLDPKDRKKDRSPRSRGKARAYASHVERSKKQQAIGMESRDFRIRRRLGNLHLDELVNIQLVAPEMLSDREASQLENAA